MKNTFYTQTCLALLLALFVLTPLEIVKADAWWGNGYRSPEWVISHGGTIIRSTTVGSSANDVKGVMRLNGKYVEVEFGRKMVFDDAKDGVYTISYYDCNKDCRYQETDNKTKIRGNDSLKDTITINARPGQTVLVEFNTETKKARIISGGAAPRPQLTAAQLAEIAAEQNEGNAQSLTALHPAMTFTSQKNNAALPLPKQTYLAN